MSIQKITSSSSQEAPILQLPTELLVIIFNNIFREKDLASVQSVCKKFRDVVVLYKGALFPLLKKVFQTEPIVLFDRSLKEISKPRITNFENKVGALDVCGKNLVYCVTFYRGYDYFIVLEQYNVESGSIRRILIDKITSGPEKAIHYYSDHEIVLQHKDFFISPQGSIFLPIGCLDLESISNDSRPLEPEVQDPNPNLGLIKLIDSVPNSQHLVALVRRYEEGSAFADIYDSKSKKIVRFFSLFQEKELDITSLALSDKYLYVSCCKIQENDKQPKKEGKIYAYLLEDGSCSAERAESFRPTWNLSYKNYVKESAPKQLVSEGERLLVSCFNGQIVRLHPLTLEIENFLTNYDHPQVPNEHVKIYQEKVIAVQKGQIYVWDFRKNNELNYIDRKGNDLIKKKLSQQKGSPRINAIAFFENYIALAPAEIAHIEIWHLTTGRLIYILPLKEAAYHLKFTDNYLVASLKNDEITVYWPGAQEPKFPDLPLNFLPPPPPTFFQTLKTIPLVFINAIRGLFLFLADYIKNLFRFIALIKSLFF